MIMMNSRARITSCTTIYNLYGYAMEKSLPTGGFRWLNEKEIENFNFDIISEESPKGYIFEVDLGYPVELHNTHKDLPFCPEHAKPPGSKEEKLLTTLYDKERYVIHYSYLLQALNHGLKLKKVQRILEFDQSPWLKKYIDLNSQLRQKAKTEFEKYFYKLMNNSTFGKTMENVKNHKDVKLVSKWEGRTERKLSYQNLIFVVAQYLILT